MTCHSYTSYKNGFLFGFVWLCFESRAACDSSLPPQCPVCETRKKALCPEACSWTSSHRHICGSQHVQTGCGLHETCTLTWSLGLNIHIYNYNLKTSVERTANTGGTLQTFINFIFQHGHKIQIYAFFKRLEIFHNNIYFRESKAHLIIFMLIIHEFRIEDKLIITDHKLTNVNT